MIVSRVSDYLHQHRRVSLLDLSLGLDTDAQALRAMLAVLERKGRVRRLPAGTSCGGGCTRCKPESIELFEWIQAPPKG